MKKPELFIQWKGTDLCGDFHCECGAHHHIDGMFVYAIKCGDCGAMYEVPTTVQLNRVKKAPSSMHETPPSDDD